MARIDWIEQRLVNWALWRLAGGSDVLGYAAVNLADADAGRSGYISAPVPILSVDASETHDAIQRLPSDLRATVECMYLGAGGNRQKLARLCCSETTMRERIDRAHRLLAAHFTDAHAQRSSERARVEGLQAAMRPNQ